MTKCHLFVNDFTSQKIRSELLDNKLESEILEWCCPVELCVMMEMFLSHRIIPIWYPCG